MIMIESKTAEKHGYGSMPYRWVSGLTHLEKAAVRQGELVFFEISKTHSSQSGYKVVTVWGGDRWGSREPTEAELKAIQGG